MSGIFGQFQEFRRILCMCPCCGDIVRVSELKLYTMKPGPKTWLDRYQESERRLEIMEERFYEQESKLRERAREKGRGKAERAFNKCISPEFCELRLDPFDMKPILNPVDFLVFKGMNKTNHVREIVFLSKVCKNTEINALRKQVKNVIDKKNYEWQVARIRDDGSITYE